MRCLIFLAIAAAAAAAPVNYTSIRLSGTEIGLSVLPDAGACAAACKDGCKGWSYCLDPVGCDGTTPSKTCILLAFKKGGPAFTGRCPAAGAAPSWASGLARESANTTALTVAASHAAQAYCDKQAESVRKRGGAVAVDIEVLPEAAG